MNKRAALATITVTLSLVLSGCAQVQQVLTPGPAGRTAPQVDQTAAYVADGSAADNEAFFALVAKEYAESDLPLTGEEIVNAFAQRGFQKNDMQVSFDKTRINLDTDSLFLSVRFGQECLIAQVGRHKRDYVTQLAPAVGPQKQQCLIGQTRPIDW